MVNLSNLKSDLVGLSVLAVLVVLAIAAMPYGQTPIGMWFFIYCGWAALAEFAWRHPKAPCTASRWLLYAVYSVIAAALWFGFSRLLSKVFFGANEPGLSLTFDLALLLILSPGLTFIAVAGSARALALAPSAD